MPRQARLDAPGTLHHGMIRGIEGTNILSLGRKSIEEIIARMCRRIGFK